MAEGMFKKATRDLARLRVGMCAPAGAGKTWSALELAFGIVRLLKPDGKVAVIDTERGSAAKYQGLIGSAGIPFEFDICTLGPDYNPRRYIEAMRDAAKAGYFIVIIDGISQAWAGTGGLLEFKDQQTAKQKSGNSWAAWREVTPEHNRFVDAMLSAPFHLIATMRAKTEWVQDVTTENGKTVTRPRKIGLAPVQRDGLEYEFDVMLDLDQDSHKALCTKTRYPQAFPDTFNERIHFDHAEKLVPLLTSEPVAAARLADEETASRAETERLLRAKEAEERAAAVAARQPPKPAAPQTPAASAPLSPGVDVPAMDKGTAPPTPGEPDKSGWSPADVITDRIAKAKSPTELLRIMPDIRKLTEPEEKELCNAIYQEKKKALITAASGGQT